MPVRLRWLRCLVAFATIAQHYVDERTLDQYEYDGAEKEKPIPQEIDGAPKL